MGGNIPASSCSQRVKPFQSPFRHHKHITELKLNEKETYTHMHVTLCNTVTDTVTDIVTDTVTKKETQIHNGFIP